MESFWGRFWASWVNLGNRTIMWLLGGGGIEIGNDGAGLVSGGP
jgi:hypothetical protein